MHFKKYKIFIIIFTAWIVLVSLTGLGLKILLNSNFIENIILKKIGFKYEAVNLKSNFDIKFNLNVSADSLKIFDENKKICFFELDNPDISIKPLSLIANNINISKFNSKNLLINIKRDENGVIDLEKAIKLDVKNSNKFNIKKINSDIQNLELMFEDNYLIKSKTKLSLNNSDIKISSRRNLYLIKEKGTIETSINNQNPQTANINLNVVLRPKTSEFNFDVDVKDINLYILSDIAKEYISKDIKTFNGIANLNISTNDFHKINLNIKNLYLTLKDGKIINPYKEINLNSELSADKDKITINNFELLSNDLNINARGDIIKPFSKKPEFDISTEIKNTQINNFLYFIPDDLIFYRPQGIPVLKKSNFHGIINGKTNVKLFPLDMSGSIKVENIHIPGYPKPYHQNDATLFFMKDKMRVYTRVYTPDNEYVTIDGVSNLDDSLYGKYSVQSTKKINLKFAQMYLVPIQQIIGFNIGPVPIMDIDGYGNIDIKTQGTIKDAQIFGQFSAYNAKALIHGLDAGLVSGSCKLIFDNRNLIFKEFKGLLDGANFLLTGIGNTKGEVDLEVKINNANLTKILKTFNNSVITQKYTSFLKNISAASGQIDTQINLSGTIKDYETEEFLNDLNLKGNFELKNNKIILNNGLNIKNIKGILNFDEEKEQDGDFEFFINNSKFNTTFSTKASLSKIAKGDLFNVNLVLNSQKLAFCDLIKEFKNLNKENKKILDFIDDFSDLDFYSKINLSANANISINDFIAKDIKTNGYIVGLNSNHNKNIKFERGLIRIDNNNFIFDNFKTLFFDGIVNAHGSTDNDLKISLSNINLEKFDKLLPKTKLQNAILKSGEINIKKDNIKLNAINIDYNKMPVLINLTSKINSKVNNFEANFSTILNETTTDYVINPYLSYPVKIKGEVPIKGKLYGNLQNYFLDFTTTIPKEADISFSGANIGDTSQDREIAGKINVGHNVLSLNNLRLIKYIKNQNNKLNPLNVISLNGKIIQKDNDIYYDNLKVLTNSPVNVRILNLIFKKSILKKGNFDCNVNLNGFSKSPKLIGKINLQDLDIPLYDTQINNIKINISPNYIDANIQAKNKQSDINSDIRIVNNLSAPYIVNKISINSNKLDIEDIIQSIPVENTRTDISEKQTFKIKPQDIIVKEGNFNFDSVVFDKINIQNLKGNFSYKDNLFDLKNIIFDIAQGQINAKGNYSLKSTKLNLSANMKDCDANTLTKDFLNFSGQIFGKMTGTVELTAKNLNTPEGIRNVESNVNFAIDDGKMPKLGSLEYLLRAGNVLRNGILGLSINNLIQVLTPYKTGEFEKISGNLNISKGKVKNLEILSKGKNLSMYLFGEYDILENFADIQIYGRLSQNVSGALGNVGNASIKQFINSFSRKIDSDKNAHIQEYLDKIPLVDSSDQGGYFSAKVYGDINKDNYIKKFSWEN